MKNPRPGTTRASLSATAASSPGIFGSGASTGALLSASLIGVLSLAGSADAGENNWLGNNANWNDPTNWSFGRVPVAPSIHPDGYDDALVNNATVYPILTTSPINAFRELKVGLNGGTGRVDLRAGTIQSSSWTLIGCNGNANGTFNIADTGTPAPGLTTYAQGSGTFQGGNVLMVGREGTGELNMNTTGSFLGDELNIGDNSATASGTLRLQSGTITVNQFHVGRRGATGTATMTGGRIQVNNAEPRIGHEGTSKGTLTIDGGILYSNNATNVSRNQGTGGTGELNVNAGGTVDAGQFNIAFEGSGTGTVNLNAGTIQSRGWTRIGGNAGAAATANFNINGGLFRQINDHFILGDNGGSANVTQSAGEVNINNDSWIGNNTPGECKLNINGGTYRTGGRMLVGFNNCPAGGFLTMTGGTVTIGNYVNVGDNGSSVGTVNLNGGTLRTGALRGGPGMSTSNFGGTQLVAQRNDGQFIENFDSSTINAGGLLVDSSVYNLTAAQVFTGSGGIVKSGPGMLYLSGDSPSFSGSKTVNAGTLTLSNTDTSSGPVTVNNGSTLAVNESVYNDVVSATASSLTLSGATTSLSFNLTDLGVGPRTANTAFLNVTGNADFGTGTVRINFADENPEVGEEIPLVTYATKSGTPTFVKGVLPNGVDGTITSDATKTYFTITSINYLEWDGQTGEGWTTAGAWTNAYDNGQTDLNYTEPAGVFFSNLGAEGNVDLSGPVSPLQTNFDNATIDYTISGTGSIGGTGTVLKRGNGIATLNTSNTYTGATRIEGGTLRINTIAPAGSPSSLGLGTTDPYGLILAGGTLEYTGATPGAAIDRGIRIEANSFLTVSDVAATVTLSGQVATNGGDFTKSGPGSLTLSHPSNTFNWIDVTGGALNFDGTLPQVTTVSGIDIGIGSGSVASVAMTGNTKITSRDLVRLGITSGSGTLAMSGTAQIIQTGGWMSIGNDDDGGTRGSGTLTLEGNSLFDHTSGGDFNIGDTPNTDGILTVKDNAIFRTRGHGFWGKDVNTTAQVTISGGEINSQAWMHTSENAASTSTIKQSGGTLTFAENVHIGERGASTWEQTGGVANFNVDHLYIGQEGDVTWTQTAGTTSSNGWVVVGRVASSDNTSMDISGGTFTQAGAGQGLVIAENGKAVVTVRDAGVLDSKGGDIEIASRTGSVGTLNVNNGGLLRARRIYEQNQGASTLSFDGGTLFANTGANPSFVTGIDTATINAGGVTVDSNGQNLAFNQVFGGTGGLTKVGTGTLQLNATNTYGGATTVTAGTLGGTGSVAGTLSVGAAGTIAPGAGGTGTFTANGATTISGAYACEIAGPLVDKLVVNGTLDVSGSTLNVTNVSPPTASVYVIASYTGATPAPFAVVNAPGFTVNYAYNDGVTSTNIALVSTTATPYQAWIDTFASIPVADRDPGDDPDNDGVPNSLEFALNGVPNSGSNSGLFRVLAQDTGAPAGNELTLVAAVRDGAVFAAGPNGIQTAIKDGIQYDIEGSVNLVFPSSTVSHVGTASDTAPAATGLPDLTGSAWEYHTFRLDASEGLPTKGFLRVNAVPNP